MRRDVAAVGERVDPGVRRREGKQGAQVVEVRVDAAAGDEPEEVDAAAARERRLQDRVRGQRAVGDGAVDAQQILVEPPPGADRQVPDLRVPHLPRRQPRRLARGLEGRVRVAGEERVEDRRLRERDRVAGAGRGAAPPVGDHECD